MAGLFAGAPALPPITPAPPVAASAPTALAPIPDSAYALPTSMVEGLNQSYWNGYRLGMASREIIPSAAGVAPDQYGNGWQPYFTGRIVPMYRAAANTGGPIALNDGFNDALECGAIWRFHNP